MAAALSKDSIVAVIGAGAMGAGIAQIAALHGHRVQLHDTRLGAGDTAKRGIVEAIVEDLAAKRELIERVENVVDPACILASNTSSLSITMLGAGTKHPERIVGMHFFNPAPL